MRELARFKVEIDGLGFIIYSPFATAHIAEGERYLGAKFWEPEDVARHVRAGTLTAFCTGSPGAYDIRVVEAALVWPLHAQYRWWIKLALEVRDRTVCIRDLYDLQPWSAACPAGQSIALDDGYYDVAVGTDADTLGDDQEIVISFRRVEQLPQVTWEGVPFLGAEEE
jgi:hypothetical protein